MRIIRTAALAMLAAGLFGVSAQAADSSARALGERLATPVTTVQAAQGKTATIKVQSANMRVAPGVKSKKIEALARGTTVDVLGSKAGWTQVRHGSQTGYIASSLLR